MIDGVRTLTRVSENAADWQLDLQHFNVEQPWVFILSARYAASHAKCN